MKSARFAAKTKILVFLHLQNGRPPGVTSRQAACNASAVSDVQLPWHDHRNRDRAGSVAGAIETYC